MLPAETRAPHCLTSQGTGSGSPLRPLFPISPLAVGWGWGSKRREKNQAHPSVQSRHFYVIIIIIFYPLWDSEVGSYRVALDVGERSGVRVRGFSRLGCSVL